MVKPTRSGSALGASVSTLDELHNALVAAYAYGPVAVVEEFIEGREIAVTVLDDAEAAERCRRWRSARSRASTTTSRATPRARRASSPRRNCLPRR
ncbi:MAG: hypothetical protein R2722_13240 [Tessaracoccus sp.]